MTALTRPVGQKTAFSISVMGSMAVFYDRDTRFEASRIRERLIASLNYSFRGLDYVSLLFLESHSVDIYRLVFCRIGGLETRR